MIVYGSNPTTADSDGDQVADGDEVIAGTNLTDPASVLRITSVLRVGSAIRLEWGGTAGKTYEIERAPTLLSEEWETIGSVSGRNVMQSFTDGSPPPGAACYRLRVRLKKLGANYSAGSAEIPAGW